MILRLTRIREPVLVAALSLAATYLAIRAFALSPILAIMLVATLVSVGFLVSVPARFIAAGVLLYLPFESILLDLIPASLVLPARVAPEVAVLIAGLAALLLNVDAVLARLGNLKAPLGVLFMLWLISAVWNGISLSTGLIGFRSEFRFIGLLVLCVLSTALARDARLYGRVLVLGGLLQALVAFAQYGGGESVRRAFATDYEVVVDGVAFAGEREANLATVFGTVGNYNTLGIYLVFAWIVLAAAGREPLGLPRGAGLWIGLILVAAVVVSGSRESALALLAASVVILRIRFRFPALRLAGIVFVAAVLLVPWTEVSDRAPVNRGTYGSLATRWGALANPRTWSTDRASNFRLFLLDAHLELVVEEAPLLGFGPGAIADRRLLAEGKSVLVRTRAGREAIAFSYFYDGNWGLLLVEVGFLGALALVWLFVALARTALELSRRHWVGLALLSGVVAIAILGFFAPVLQLRLPNAFLWVFAGLCLAAMSLRHTPEGGGRVSR